MLRDAYVGQPRLCQRLYKVTEFEKEVLSQTDYIKHVCLETQVLSSNQHRFVCACFLEQQCFSCHTEASSDLFLCTFRAQESIFSIMMGSQADCNDSEETSGSLHSSSSPSSSPPPPPPPHARQQPDSSWLSLLTWLPNRSTPSWRPRWLEFIINPSVVSELKIYCLSSSSHSQRSPQDVSFSNDYIEVTWFWSDTY